ncbi:MAG: hypothetical protein M3Y27_10680 [Acidobacteriota bacterium]|nr:hypothetical protein [Acidobacteriota bacterium]
MSIDDRHLQVEVMIVPEQRTQRGRRREAESMVPKPTTIPRLARLLALAIKFQAMVERGEVRDYADLARLGYVTRARLTQIMNLLLLAPDLQEQLLFSATTVEERRLRNVVKLVEWREQRRCFTLALDELKHESARHR